MLASRLQIGQASVGLEFLLPALVGAFLGSTTIRPGRVNVWGTLVGVAILAIGISGIQQFGGAFFVEPLFNGLTLLVSIGIAGYAQQRAASRSSAASPSSRSHRIRGVAPKLPPESRVPFQLHQPQPGDTHESIPPCSDASARRTALAGALAATLAGLAGHAMADDFLALAKQKVAAATAPKNKWDGPTTGPKAQPARPSCSSPPT